MTPRETLVIPQDVLGAFSRCQRDALIFDQIAADIDYHYVCLDRNPPTWDKVTVVIESLITEGRAKWLTASECRDQYFRPVEVPGGEMRTLVRLNPDGSVIRQYGDPAPASVQARLDSAEARIVELEDVIGDLWLYIPWRFVTSQLTTPQKELAADAVDAWSARLNETDIEPVAERWWRDDFVADTAEATDGGVPAQ